MCSSDLGDLDNDGDLDIVVGNHGGDPSKAYINPQEAVDSFGRTDLSALPGTALPGSGGHATTDVAVAGGTDGSGTPLDINLDGYPDIVLAVDGGRNVIYYGSPPPSLGDFTSVAPTIIGDPATAPESSQSVTLVDVDGDGDTDAVYGNADGTATTYYNDHPHGGLTLYPTRSLAQIGRAHV